MGESAIAQSAPSAAGALGRLLTVQVRRAAVRLPRLAPVRGPVPAPSTDEWHEHAYRPLTMPSGQAVPRAAKWRDRLGQAAGQPGPGRGSILTRHLSAVVR